VNSASELHCSREQYNSHVNSVQYTLFMLFHCSVNSAIACTVRKKQHFAAFSSPAYQTLKCVGPMYSKVCISFYQTAANCVLIKTQPRSQTGSLQCLALWLRVWLRVSYNDKCLVKYFLSFVLMGPTKNYGYQDLKCEKSVSL